MADSAPQRTLIVEDDPEMRSFYARLFGRLSGEGYSAVIVPNVEEALAVLRRETVNLALIDWNLPGLSGISLLCAMREHPKTRDIGVIMVTARTSPDDEIRALDAGADDHLSKPFKEEELLARMRCLRRRLERSLEQRGTPRLPGLEFDPETGMIRIDGRSERLTAKEKSLLQIFLSRPDMVHTYQALWDAFWGYETVRSEHLIDATVSSLRRKLGEKWSERLKYHFGQGFIFESLR